MIYWSKVPLLSQLPLEFLIKGEDCTLGVEVDVASASSTRLEGLWLSVVERDAGCWARGVRSSSGGGGFSDVASASAGSVNVG